MHCQVLLWYSGVKFMFKYRHRGATLRYVTVDRNCWPIMTHGLKPHVTSLHHDVICRNQLS